MEQLFTSKEIVNIPEITLCGLLKRTSLNEELNALTAKIPLTISSYWSSLLANKAPNLVDPQTSYSLYTNYETNEYGPYDYFFGQAVDNIDAVPAVFSSLVLAPQKMVKFTTIPGAMPHLVIKAWQNIWQMSTTELGGKRTYLADYEVYDHRAVNLANAIIDLYVSIE